MFQNDEWKVVQDNFELTNQEELSLNGFLQLHLMEAEDNCGNILMFSFFMAMNTSISHLIHKYSKLMFSMDSYRGFSRALGHIECNGI